MKQIRIPAVYMRGGTSKGVFFHADDLPAEPARRDALLLRVVGSPDPYGQQIDGLGGGSSSTSKVVILSPSRRPDCDVDYLFGAVAIDRPVIDWSGNCGNLSAAVGPYALARGLLPMPAGEGLATVRIWQVNTGKRLLAHVPVAGGEVVEGGDFELDGVTFPAAEIRLEFLDLGRDDGPAAAVGLFPTGRPVDRLDVPGLGQVQVTLIDAGNPAVFVEAAALGLQGTERQAEVNGDAQLLERCERLRCHGAVAMGLAPDTAAAALRPATPKLAWVAPARDYRSAAGRLVAAGEIDLNVRILSMGRLHHAMTGTGAVAIAAAAAVPGTVLAGLLGAPRTALRFGHPSGTLAVGAEARLVAGHWSVQRVQLSRSARRLMEGHVLVPAGLG